MVLNAIVPILSVLHILRSFLQTGLFIIDNSDVPFTIEGVSVPSKISSNTLTTHTAVRRKEDCFEY